MILEEAYDNCDQYWLWCDIDGRGESWHLAVRFIHDDDSQGIKFPHDDFDDYADQYWKAPCEPILCPKNLENDNE